MSKYILLAFIGVSGGIVVGNAAAAFIALLKLVPRLIQITKTQGYIKIYEYSLVFSISIFSMLYFIDISLKLNKCICIFIGLCFGIFIGMLASALTEILDVMPVLSKKFDLRRYVFYIILIIVLGKVIGSIFYWLVLVKLLD